MPARISASYIRPIEEQAVGPARSKPCRCGARAIRDGNDCGKCGRSLPLLERAPDATPVYLPTIMAEHGIAA